MGSNRRTTGKGVDEAEALSPELDNITCMTLMQQKSHRSNAQSACDFHRPSHVGSNLGNGSHFGHNGLEKSH